MLGTAHNYLSLSLSLSLLLYTTTADAHSGPRGLIQRLAYLSAAAQVVRAAATALLAPPCVTLARSEVPREERESGDRGRSPDISHHARAGLTCNERQDPLGASCYAGRWPAGRRAIVGGVIVATRCWLQLRGPGPRCIGQMISASGSTTLL